MSALVIEHIPVEELPIAWRARLAKAEGTLVTVRIEEEAEPLPTTEFVTDDPAFGIWRDHEEIVDVAAHGRKIREPRYNHDGSRNET